MRSTDSFLPCLCEHDQACVIFSFLSQTTPRSGPPWSGRRPVMLRPAPPKSGYRRFVSTSTPGHPRLQRTIQLGRQCRLGQRTDDLHDHLALLRRRPVVPAKLLDVRDRRCPRTSGLLAQTLSPQSPGPPVAEDLQESQRRSRCDRGHLRRSRSRTRSKVLGSGRLVPARSRRQGTLRCGDRLWVVSGGTRRRQRAPAGRKVGAR